MSQDISKNAVLVLALVAVTISLLSTGLVLNALSQSSLPESSSSTGSSESDIPSSAVARLYVTGPDPGTVATGKVTLTVINENDR